MKIAIILCASLAGPALAQPEAPAPSQAIGRTELQRHDLSVRGHEAVQVRVDFSPGAIAPRHRHPGEELVFVLRGSVETRIEGGPPTMLNAGDTQFIRAGAVHEARAGERGASILATYIVAKGQPLLTPAPGR